MSDAKLVMFDNRLKKVFRILGKEARRQNVSCYRLYDRDLPEFPLIVDIYGDEVLVTEYRSHHKLSEEDYIRWLEDSIEVIVHVLGKTQDQVHLKERKRKESRQDQYRKTGEEGAFIEVTEGGLRFLVNLSDYLDTGLFIDHRITRDLVRRVSSGKRILNLFCYTGSFSVYAADGGATAVCSVDLSNTYLEWSRKNMALNGFVGDKYTFVRADVLQWLPTVPGHSFDVIILDPPTFSNSKSMVDVFDIQAMHPVLINTCLSKLAPGGTLYFSTNARKFEMDSSAVQGAVKEITTATTPFDFKGKLLRWCYEIKPV